MADLTQYMTQKYTKLIAEITADLGKTADDLANGSGHGERRHSFAPAATCASNH